MSQYPFALPDHGDTSPQAWYASMQQHPGFVADAAQARAIEELDVLWHALVEFKARRNQFLGRSLLSPEVPKGLYLWGGVGRGKSFLMDVFYASLPYKRKRRIHFHNFMSEVHHELKQLSEHKDPLIALADRIEKSTRLLCFDEFHVSDIADAMILGRLLEALFERGVVMIMTSNSAPDNLYQNGLQRQKFLPAIDLIKHNLKVIKIDSGNDYRLREMAGSPLFMLNNAASDARMHAIFTRLSSGTEQNFSSIEIQGRQIPVKQVSRKAVWFDFAEICGGPRAQDDYLQIARLYPLVLISNIPKLGEALAGEIQRFIWLVDIFYDNRVKLVASATVPIEQICQDKEKQAEFSRTFSRLNEMQTQNYLELPHQAETFTLT